MGVRAALFGFYRALQRTIAPGLKDSQSLYEDTLESHVKADTEWLDVGCGHHVLPLWRGEQERSLVTRCRRMVGVDANFTSLSKHRSAQFRVLGTVSDLPFRDEAFDLVTANMVVEHLDSPEVQFHEVARVLKPGGLFILHTPNRLGYSTLIARAIPEWIKKTMIRLLEARQEGDVFPTFYRVNTAEEIERTAKVTGFDVRQLRLIASSASLVIFPPLVACELIWIRMLMTQRFKHLRTNIIGILQRRLAVKPQGYGN